jgi:hypothetical protein
MVGLGLSVEANCTSERAKLIAPGAGGDAENSHIAARSESARGGTKAALKLVAGLRRLV